MLTGFVIGDRGLGASGDTHPNWMMAHAEVGPYLVVGASAVGQIHLAKQLPRDDAFAIRSVGSWLAVAVADGVGTRPLSRYGAAYVVESLTLLLLRKLVPPVNLVKNKSSTGALPPLLSRDDVELKYLAPPPTAEEIEPKLFAEFTLPAPNRAGAKLISSSYRDMLLQEFRQVGSTGWWLAPSPAQSASTTNEEQQSYPSAHQFKTFSPTTGPDRDVAPDASPHEPDLKEIMTYAFTNTHIGLRDQASYLGLELSDLSCTALTLLLNVETGQGVVGQVGDGAVLGLPTRGQMEELVHAADTGDPQSTYTINNPNFSKYLAVNPITPSSDNPFKALYVMTDGLSSDLLFTALPPDSWAKGVNANLQAASSPAAAAAEMLNWLSTYQVKGSWDDRTLVVIMQREKSNGNSQPVTGQSQSAQSTDDK
ncbi:MAG TPA: protein phosphatase 2C domain-containing protein [Ktedonosporobacter sp.]|nr:protein phosphatase 2C domain-containing protein [Ktedonosporobacter sp.]